MDIMPRRRHIACLLLGLLSLTASGATLELHHPDACSSSHNQSSECRTCYLIMVGRTAVSETPVNVPIGDEILSIAPPIAPVQIAVGDHHTSAAPRAPPAV